MRIAATLLVVPSIVLLFGAFQTAHGERENGLRESWNSSPGMLLTMAALDTAQTPTKEEEIPTRITNAKLLYEMGHLTESQAILMQVMSDDPSNQTAAYYLNLIKEAQFMARHRDPRFGWDGAPRSYGIPPPTSPPIPNGTATANPQAIPLAAIDHPP